MRSSELALRLVNVAPCPASRRDGTHHRMLGFMKVFGRVFARRRVATADMSARSALAQRHPKSSLAQTLFARVRRFLWREVIRCQTLQVLT